MSSAGLCLTTDCKISDARTTAKTINIDFAGGTFVGNNLYAPNASDGDILARTLGFLRTAQVPLQSAVIRRYVELFAIEPGAELDVFVAGRMPAAGVDVDSLDQLLGVVLTACDEPFNELLVMGFLSSMRKEWEWRVSRGESLRNLEAFRGILAGPGDPDPGSAPT